MRQAAGPIVSPNWRLQPAAMISVVIPTLNAEATLGQTLAALVSAAVDGLVREVIVVDGGSSDRTAEIVDQAGANLVRGSGGRGHQPHFPPPALRIDKGPITHPPPNLAISASRPELTSYGFADEVPKSSLFVTELRFLFGNVRIFF